MLYTTGKQDPLLLTGIKTASCSGGHHSIRKYFCIVAVIAAMILISPAQAGTKYMAGSPELSVYISGTNEFSPGDEVTFPVTIENTGVNEFKFVKSGIVDTEDLTNTAKHLTVTLGTGNAPMVIKSDAQMVGELKASTRTTASFVIKINRDAIAGTYNLPVTLNYTYLYQADQWGSDTIEYQYKDMTEVRSLPIKIKPEVQIDVLSVNAETLNVGNEGYLTLTIKNTGNEDGKKSIVTLVQNGHSPVSPTEGSVYIGNFPSGATADCRFRVAVSSDAEAKTYPLDVYVKYENNEGDMVQSESETIGVPVGKKVDFAVVSTESSIPQGSKRVIKVEYENTGGTTAYNVQARISAVDPFTSNDDTAFLGTLAPGERKTASFDVSVDRSATLKDYGLDSEMNYRDSLDNSYTSNPMKVNVRVVESKNLTSMLTSPLGLAIIAIVIIAAGYLLYKRRNIAQ